MITLVLDGRTVATEPGRTVLQACREHGVPVPTLCHLDGLSPVASCRLCLVEVDELPRPVPACATAVWDGMRVTTRSGRLDRHRRAVIELLFANGDHVCAACPASGCCELQDLAQALGVDHVALEVPRRARRVDASRPGLLLDRGRCVLCTRCVRACAELEGAGTLAVVGRGSRTRIATDGGARWGDSASCTDCARCAAACPTGALLEEATAAQGLAARARTRHVPPPPRPVVARPSVAPAARRRTRLATMWLGGCSGCHMSLLDLDEGLVDLAPALELVHSPLADAPELPADVDVCLVEGAVATCGDAAELRRARERSRTLVALGDCACFGGVTAMRDARGGAAAVLRRAGGAEGADPALPALLDRVQPLAEVVRIDVFLPGCPPGPGLIGDVLLDLAAGRAPALGGRPHFG